MIGKVEDLDNGVVVYQVTDEAEDASNIYCEQCYCAPDGSCFVYIRFSRQGDEVHTEYVACDFATWDKWVITESESLVSSVGCDMPNGGLFYYVREGVDRHAEMVAVDLIARTKRVIELPNSLQTDEGFTISPGERYVAYGETLCLSPLMYGVNLLDLKTGATERIHQDPDICNPHLQFEPGEGKFLMVQHNRGCEFSPEGECIRLAGDEGATLFFLEVPGGRVIRTKIGHPYTDGISGHETWLGTSGELILTLNTNNDYDAGKGAVLCVRPDTGELRDVCAPYEANHIGADMAGRVFVGEAVGDDIVLGSPHSGKTVTVCSVHNRYTRQCYEPETCLTDHHPHAYVSSDCKWVVFNSNRTGTLQVYVASIPPEMLASIECGSGA